MLYLQKLFESSSKGSLGNTSGRIELTIPSFNNSSPKTLIGYTGENITYTLSNRWGTLLPGDEDLAKISGLFGQKTILNWINSSTVGWLGSEPLTIPLVFYLISYKPPSSSNPPITEQLYDLVKLCTVNVPKSVGREATVEVHGGYNQRIYENNVQLTLDNRDFDEQERGVISLKIGNRFKLRGLVLKEINPEHSIVETRDGIPLYIKVKATFQTYRTITPDNLKEFLGIN